MRVAAVQDALMELIAAAVPEAPVGLGRPDVITTGEAVWISDAVESRYEALTTGLASQMRSEVVTVRVIILVAETAGEYRRRRDRALEHARKIEAAVAADQTLGGLVELATVARMRSEDAATPKGSVTSVELEIAASSTLPTP